MQETGILSFAGVFFQVILLAISVQLDLSSFLFVLGVDAVYVDHWGYNTRRDDSVMEMEVSIYIDPFCMD